MPDSLMAAYARLPIAFERGEGAWLYDQQGAGYLDALSGIAVCGLGHAHPEIAEAVSSQAATLVHTSNVYRIPVQETLASRLCGLSGMDKVFFGNSGAEANEAAIKIARLHGHQQGFNQPTIVVTEGSFHGRTMATLSATGNRKVQAGYEPLVEGFVRVPYNDVDALTKVSQNSAQVVAVFLEPIQGEGGVVVPRPDYLSAVRQICDEHGWLLILDEIQTGMCRTGKWFAFQHEAILPDVLTLAKALGNGVPIGACLARAPAADLIQPGAHGSTFGGNPLACRAALATIEVMQRDELAERATRLGAHMLDRLRQGLTEVDAVRDVRGKGLMIGIELDRQCTELVSLALESKLLINVTSERVVRLLPPLIVTETELDRIADQLIDLIQAFALSSRDG